MNASYQECVFLYDGLGQILCCLPLEPWTDDGLSYVVSAIDLCTLMILLNSQLSYLHKHTFEIESTKEIPKSFVLNLAYGEPYEGKVEVPWKPQDCNECKICGQPLRHFLESH